MKRDTAEEIYDYYLKNYDAEAQHVVVDFLFLLGKELAAIRRLLERTKEVSK